MEFLIVMGILVYPCQFGVRGGARDGRSIGLLVFEDPWEFSVAFLD